MKKDRNKGGSGRSDRQGPVEQPEEAYVYLVKNPSSNELCICAWDSALYPGTQVVAPTRYGLDLGMVLGSAADIGQAYEPGCVQCRGVCLRAEEPVVSQRSPDEPVEQEACGELTTDGAVLIEQDGSSVVEWLAVEDALGMADAAASDSSGIETLEESACVISSDTPSPDVAMDGATVETAECVSGEALAMDEAPTEDMAPTVDDAEVSAVSAVSVAEPPRAAETLDVSWMKEPDEDSCAGCGECYRKNQPRMVEIDGDVDWIDRLATPDDLRRYQENLEKEEDALKLCREKVARHGLDMKLVTAHYLLGEPKLLFFFTADVRVDFRELVKDLVSVFRIRIELRQIGVRDESRVLGGLAVCGRDFCCHSVTDKLNPVSIKMAKEQNLSLNSMKISGPCGRLLCCLSYEYDFYMEEKQKYPPEGSRLKIDHDLMKITEVNILSRKISLAGPDGRFLTIPCSAVYFNEEMNRWEITKAYLDEFFSN